MADEGPTIDDFSPSWMEDGYGISGPQADYVEEDLQQWDTNFATIGGEPDDDYQPPGGEGDCTPPGSPDTSKVYVRTTSWDGSNWVCDWTETCDATCP